MQSNLFWRLEVLRESSCQLEIMALELVANETRERVFKWAVMVLFTYSREYAVGCCFLSNDDSRPLQPSSF